MASKTIDAETSKQLISLLPHRYPFLLVDRIVEYEPGQRIVGVKSVSRNEPYFVGHFPDYPVMPGVLIIEAMAQTAGVLAIDTSSEPGDALPFFTRIDKVRFRRPVTPGDQIRLELEVLRRRHPVWWFHGRAFVDGELAVEGNVQATLGKRKR